MENTETTNYESQAFDLAVSFYKIFEIDPYKWAALYQSQIDLIREALEAAEEKGWNDAKGI